MCQVLNTIVNEEKNKVLYFHKKPCGEIFYVGIGNKTRPYTKQSRSNWWHNITNKYEHTVEIVKENLTHSEAVVLEKFYIKEIGRRDLKTGTLINQTDGGDGIINPTQEIRDKIGATHKGMRHSEKTLKQMSEVKLGKIKTEEHRKNLSLSLIGKPKSDTHKTNMSIARKGKPLTDAQKNANKKNGESRIGTQFSSEIRNKIAEIKRQKNFSLGLKVSQYKGVVWDKKRKKWKVSVYSNGKPNFIGRFDNEIDAFENYNEFIKNI